MSDYYIARRILDEYMYRHNIQLGHLSYREISHVFREYEYKNDVKLELDCCKEARIIKLYVDNSSDVVAQYHHAHNVAHNYDDPWTMIKDYESTHRTRIDYYDGLRIITDYEYKYNVTLDPDEFRRIEEYLKGGQTPPKYEVRTIDGSSGDDSLAGDEGRDYMDGGAGNDTLKGAGGADTLVGGDGNDALYGGDGNDQLHGAAGDDVLHGGAGQDQIWSASGADTFDFDSVTESSVEAPDVIRLFEGAGDAAGDRIDLSGIDADMGASGNQEFVFLGAIESSAPNPSAARSLYLREQGGDTFVFGNVDSNAEAELAIQIMDGGVQASDYTAADFILLGRAPRPDPSADPRSGHVQHRRHPDAVRAA
jgi:hypothetical protein